ncbi:hypothetical protein KQX54_008005 [Cotesia glomerata]|uniref:Uncharacterized protein n=1 Tax=Cotesia glomerata TaxID=32391 RepID=A0AAV7I7W9_COTGL|nr:hypothetical protein KQX54_008005 [Cotesia glomerata]
MMGRKEEKQEKEAGTVYNPGYDFFVGFNINHAHVFPHHFYPVPIKATATRHPTIPTLYMKIRGFSSSLNFPSLLFSSVWSRECKRCVARCHARSYSKLDDFACNDIYITTPKEENGDL